MVEHIAIYYDTAHGITYKDMYNTMHIQCTVKYDITEYNRIQHNIIWYDTIWQNLNPVLGYSRTAVDSATARDLGRPSAIICHHCGVTTVARIFTPHCSLCVVGQGRGSRCYASHDMLIPVKRTPLFERWEYQYEPAHLIVNQWKRNQWFHRDICRNYAHLRQSLL